jgi:metal-sulfur cluster biosynthetic enzyme
LTSPACPVAETLPGEVHDTVARVEGVHSVHVEQVWDPPWTPPGAHVQGRPPRARDDVGRAGARRPSRPALLRSPPHI